MKKHFTLAVICLLLVTTLSVTLIFLNARKPVEFNDKNVQRALVDVTNTTLVPATTDFSESTGRLHQALVQLCETPNEQLLATARQQWVTTAMDWGRLSNFVMGPLNDDLVFPRYTFIDSLRLRGSDYTDTVREDQASDLNSTTPINAEYIAGKTFQKVGLLALEVALFEVPGSTSAPSEILKHLQAEPRKCELAIALASQLHSQAQYVETGWQKSFKGTDQSFAELFKRNNTQGGMSSFGLLVVSIKDNLEYIRKRNVVQTAAVLADNNWAFVAAAVNEAEKVFAGTPSTRVSYYALMEAAGHEDKVIEMKENFDFARQCIEEQNKVNLDLALSLLEANVKIHVPEAFGLDLGINFSDGD